MSAELIKCPNCGADIPITDALAARINEIEKEAEQKAERELEKKSTSLRKKEEEFEAAKKNLDKTVDERVKIQAQKIKQQTEREVTEKLTGEMGDLQLQLSERDKKIKEYRTNELELRKKQRELEEKQNELELEVARKIEKERDKIRQDALKKVAEDHHLKDLEKDRKINELSQMLDEMKRKAEQGSMEEQGEAFEQDLEAALKSAFPQDEIEPIPKGKGGADIIQYVRNNTQQRIGIILWEAKSTKNWSDKWISKLKDDQRETSADIAVIISNAMPEGIELFGNKNGVWISVFKCVLGLATAFRVQFMEIAYARQAEAGRVEKAEILYDYLTSNEFRQRIAAIVETYTSMKKQLDKEKGAMQRLWKEREKQAELIITNTAQLFGAVRGIVGSALPMISSLELAPVHEPKRLTS